MLTFLFSCFLLAPLTILQDLSTPDSFPAQEDVKLPSSFQNGAPSFVSTICFQTPLNVHLNALGTFQFSQEIEGLCDLTAMQERDVLPKTTQEPAFGVLELEESQFLSDLQGKSEYEVHQDKEEEDASTKLRDRTLALPDRFSDLQNNRVTFFTEALYWQLIQDNLLASIKANGINSGALSGLVWVNQRFNYAPGFKVGLGGFLPYDHWHFSVSYTFLKTTSSQHSKNAHPEFYMVLSGQMQSLAEQVKATWQMHFQAFDVMLGRELSITPYIKIKPQMGIKGAYPNQKWHVTYIRPTIHQTELIFSNQRINNFFWSLGPNLELGLSWKLPREWALQIRPSWSLMYSRIYSKVMYSNIANAVSEIDSNTIVKGVQNMVSLIPQMEIWLGSEWTYFFHRNRLLKITFGYDVQYWWNEANILAFTQLPQGNLLLHGATFGLHFAF